MLKQRSGWAIGLAAGAVALYGIFLGCRGGDVPAQAAPGSIPPGPSPRAAAPASSPAAVAWDRSDKGIRLKYPSDWLPKKSADYELMLLPPGAANELRRVTLDIPDLPPHLAFMIQMGRVQSGYIDDLKKDHPGLQVKQLKDVSLPDCKAKLIESTWRQNGQTFEDVALLLIHDGNVYILDAETDEDHLPPTRSAFDFIESTLQWAKR